MIPTGIVTFLFSDIEDSTRLAQSFPDSYQKAFEKYQLNLNEIITSHNGFVFKTSGSSFCCSFENANDAVNAAVTIQTPNPDSKDEQVSIKIKIGINTGPAEWTGNDYSGYVTLASVSRIMSVSNGQQILISGKTFEIVKDNISPDTTFLFFGQRKLKDIETAVSLYQVCSEKIPSHFPPLKTLDERPNNFPAELSSFIGREEALNKIKSLLRTSSLLTLIGPGGTGKTRLTLRVGEDVIDEFEGGVWFIELAPLNDSELIRKKIATVLNIKEEPGADLMNTISDLINEKGKLLLILDNCEHVIIECIAIADRLLKKCPHLKIMCSSREALKIQGEMIFKVPVLTLPETNELLTAKSVSKYEAIRLFTERAKAVKSDFEITDEIAATVAQLCKRLDGIPLAIELAAARIKIFSVDKILDKISDRFKLLSGGNRSLLPRQQTLKALIDWSYELLSEKEKNFFAGLSVFSGGWNIDAAENVCVTDDIDEIDVLDLISDLIDKSLIVSKEIDGLVRYSMLETILEYAGEKLLNKDEVCKKHFQYYLDLITSHAVDVDYTIEIKFDREINADIDNFRSALKWSLENAPAEYVALAAKLSVHWEVNGNYLEAFSTLTKLLTMDIKMDENLKAALSVNAGYISSQLNEYEIGEKFLDEGYKYFKSTGNITKQAEALSIYGMISYLKGDVDKAMKQSKEGLELLKDTDEKIIIANIKGNLAAYNSSSGNPENSLQLLDEAINLYKELNRKDLLAKLLISKGGIHYQAGDLEKAKELFEEGLPILQEINDQYSIGVTFYNLGNIYFAQKKYSESIDYYERAMTMATEFGNLGTFDRSHIKIGEIFLMQNENEKAKKIFVDSLKSFGRNSEKLKLSIGINGLGKYYFYEKDYEKAAKLFLLTDRLSEYTHYKFSKTRLDENKIILDEIKSKLTGNKFNELNKEVMKYDLEKAVEIAVGMSE